MKQLLNSFFSLPTRRRPLNRSAFGSSFDTYEDRTLLSGVAIYPQPAAAVATEDVTPAADPPGDFSGVWDITSSQGDGSANITQTGNKIDVVFTVNALDFEGSGKVKGDTAKGKVKLLLFGQKIKGKLITTLTGPDAMEGTAIVKKSPIGRLDLPFTGIRTTN
ncbi:MAG: hypothetical protein KDA36_13380 [Planctomycetaceae bacterium]|nr:hypothetical protein [Planctomycetaceae bacterium]